MIRRGVRWIGWRERGDSYTAGLILRPQRTTQPQPVTIEIPPPWRPVVRVSPTVVRRREKS